MKLRFLLVALLLALPSLALAQGETVGLTGTYDYTGGEGASAYSGSVTLTGSGPVYWLSYSDDLGQDTPDEGGSIALAQGTIVAAALGEACYPATIVRQSDGALFGMWHDSENEAVTAIGMEVSFPQADTTDFAGTYDVVGTYADGTRYVATSTIVARDGGWYELLYTYYGDGTSDEVTEEYGFGIAVGNVLAYAYTGEDTACVPYVLDLSGGKFRGYYLTGDGTVATETGRRAG